MRISSRAVIKLTQKDTGHTSSDIINITDMEGGPISGQHGTAEREVGGIGTGVAAGSVSAGSGENSFEEVPPRYESPPGLSERQKADCDRAEQTNFIDTIKQWGRQCVRNDNGNAEDDATTDGDADDHDEEDGGRKR